MLYHPTFNINGLIIRISMNIRHFLGDGSEQASNSQTEMDQNENHDYTFIGNDDANEIILISSMYWRGSTI